MSETSGEDLRKQPRFSQEEAEQILFQSFGILGRGSTLPSERDQNFCMKTEQQTYILKIANPETQLSQLELENSAIRLCEACSFLSPRLVRAETSRWIESVLDANGTSHSIRCLEFVPGVPLAAIENADADLFRAIGRALAEMDLALAHLNHNTGVRRELKWDLKNAPAIIRGTIEQLKNPDQQRWLEKVLSNFQTIEDRIEGLPHSVIHNDANDYNVIVGPADELDEWKVGFIDFGDMMWATTVNELAICLAYLMLDRRDPIGTGVAFVAGYDQLRPLSEGELSVLFPLACMRLGQSVCIARQQQLVMPDNEYLNVTETPAWRLIESLVELDPEEVRFKFASVCQLEHRPRL